MRILKFLWGFPIWIIKSGVIPLPQGSNVDNTRAPRRRPLYTCGASIFTIVDNACAKMQDLDGSLGLVTRRVSKLMRLVLPLIYAMQYQWLSVLSFMDDQILAAETVIEMVFPPSTHLFDKIDELVCSAEGLPGKFDNALNRFPDILHQVPILEWILVHLITRLNLLMSILTHWGTKNTREKEIVMDMNCQNHGNEQSDSSQAQNSIESEFPVLDSHKDGMRNRADAGHCDGESPSYETYEYADSSFGSDCSQDDLVSLPQRTRPDVPKCSYKEVLEKGTKENGERTEGDGLHKCPDATTSDVNVGIDWEKGTKLPNEEGIAKDQIIELFESSWHMK